ncbi:MAG TPA: hypothetical protein DEP05_08390 [Betaproteobacteria bacterium]|nr:hypothetical protein [Betaproteobacteria bacterium]
MIPFIRPTLPSPEAWLPFLRASYAARYFSNGGPCARQLEAALTQKYAQPQREAILVSSGTSGITAALLALDIHGPVVVPAFTFPATAQAVLAAGCTPVFCDVSLATWELDPQSLTDILANQTIQAIIHVRAFGFCQDITSIEDIAAAHTVPLLVDAAAALGGRLPQGPYAGGQGLLEIFSLHATKVFGIGEGGVIFAPPGRAAEKIRTAIHFGLENDAVVGRGVNGKLSEFGAAVGLALLANIDDFIAHRAHRARHYASRLAAHMALAHPEAPGAPPWQSFPVLLDPLDTALSTTQVVAACKDRGLEIKRYYHPALHTQRCFASGARLPHSEQLANRMVCLPIYSDMTVEENESVIQIFLHSLGMKKPIHD